MHTIIRTRPARRWAALALVLFTAALPHAQSAAQSASQGAKKVLTIDDYSRWKSIEGSRISGDGKWVAYELRQTNIAEAKPTLHLLEVDSNRDQEVASASGAIFSDDSRWVAYSIEPPSTAGRGGRGAGGGGGAPAPAPAPATPPAQGGRGGGQANTPRKVELRNLATGAVRSWEDITAFSFAASSSHLLLRRRQPTQNPTHRGVDVVLHELATGRDQLLGSVYESAFNKNGDLLAYTVDAAIKDANGVLLIDLRTGRTVALDSDARNYSRLTWSDSGNALAVLKGQEVEKQRERENVLIAFPDIRAALDDSQRNRAVLDPASAANFPKGWLVSERGTLSWSDDGKRVFFGIKEQGPQPDTAGQRRGTDFVADVDVWRTSDQRIQSLQIQRAEADRNFTHTQAFDVTSTRFIALADSTMRDLDVSQDGRWAVGRDARKFVSDYARPRADVYRVNTATGERSLMFKALMVGNQSFGISPDGNHFLYWQDNQVKAYDLDKSTTRVITQGSPVSFIDTDYDHYGPKPAYGIAGYSKDGKSVILESRYDLWQFPLDGSGGGRNITGSIGARGEMRFAYVRTESEGAGAGGRGGRGGGAAPTIDLSKPVLLSAYGEWTKKAGFYELRDGQMRELVYADAIFSTPAKANKADRYLFARQSFVEFPDLQVSGLDFKDAKKITNANPQHSEYSWGRRILFDYKNKKGVRLQGTLAIPDTYKPGDKLPMLVNFYEKNSQNLNRYLAPTYLSSMGSLPVEALTKGYLLMQPDIHFNTRTSHSDMLECIEAAVRKVIEMGYVDPKHIGINGHSYSGQGVAFVGTRSRLFAAIGMGAGVTDLTSDFSHNWGWSYQIGGTGANGFDYYIYGQGRQATNPWDDPELFRFESARTHVREVTAPFLIMHGTADPTVAFQEGLGFYNALRFNNKVATLLAYPGEGHGLRGIANRRDLTIRYMQFFDHYLKGAPEPRWLAQGVPFLDKDFRRDAAKELPAATVTSSSSMNKKQQ